MLGTMTGMLGDRQAKFSANGALSGRGDRSDTCRQLRRWQTAAVWRGFLKMGPGKVSLRKLLFVLKLGSL